MDEPDDRITRTSGMTTWRAGCTETRTSGSEGGPQKPTRRKPDRPLRPDPYTRLGGAAKWNWFYLYVIIDIYSRYVPGWMLATAENHTNAKALLADTIRKQHIPAGQLYIHSDRGSQYTSWAFGQRLRAAGLLGSMGRVGSAYDNAMMESFFGTLQRELLDRRSWTTRKELASAIFEWIEAWYNPRRRHTSIDNLSPVDYERLYTAAIDAA